MTLLEIKEEIKETRREYENATIGSTYEKSLLLQLRRLKQKKNKIKKMEK